MTDTRRLQAVKAAVDALLLPRGQVASLDMYLLDGLLIIPLVRPSATIEAVWWPVSSNPNEISIFDLMNEETT